jgi:hypothetical protein
MRRLAVLALCGCGALLAVGPGAETGGGGDLPAAARPTLTVVLAGALAGRDDARAALGRALGADFDVAFAGLPSAPTAPPAAAQVDADLAAARAAYVGAEFSACLAAVGRPDRATGLLAESKRTLAERLLFWRVACEVGGGRGADARHDAAVFAALELEAPPDVEAAAPEVEARLADAARAAAAEPRAALAVRATPAAAHAVVSLDGRAAVCAAPCTLDVRAGDHVVRVDADGFVAETRLVRVDPTGAGAEVALTPAGPDLAARQWTARYAGSAAVDAPASVTLLALAVRARRLALFSAEAGGSVTGVLAVDGNVSARGERPAATSAEVAALARDLLVRGSLIAADPPLTKRPLFWIGVGGAAVVAAAVTAILLYQPTPDVRVTAEGGR